MSEATCCLTLSRLTTQALLCRVRLRQFPSLVNCCTIDWYTPWPRDALEAVAIKFLKEIDMEEKQRTDIMVMCKMFHVDVHAVSEKFRKLQGRINYVTPTSYLELITMFTTLLDQQRGIVSMQQKRYNVRLRPVVESGYVTSCL